MSREITHEENGPTAIDLSEHEGDIHICRCGLSEDQPFCDGSHTATADEEAGVNYKYENDSSEGPRHTIESIVFADE